jgi:hypothetical protein
MRRFRFTVAGLMAVILLLAAGMAALRDPSTLWASAIFTAAVLLFAVAVIAAMAHSGLLRLTWAGVAVFGWVYLIIGFGPWPGNAVGPPPLLPSSLLDRFQEYIVSDGKSLYQVHSMHNDSYKETWSLRGAPAGARSMGVVKIVDVTAYRQTGHSLGALLCGILGAFAGRIFAARRERSAHDG